MTRKGDTVLVAALKRYGNTMKKYIQDCLHKDMKVKLLIEDARDSQEKASGAAYLEIAVYKKGGWGGENQIEIHGTIGFDKAGKKGKKEDEAYLDGVTVGDWEEGSKAIGLSGCSIGEFLVHIFSLFAIKAGNESVLLDNAAGPRGEHIYRQVGFIKSKGDRAQYGDDNEMIFPLTGKKKNKDAGQLWRERYNKFRKKLATKIKNSANCKTFWKCVPPALEAPGPVHMLARGSKRRTRKKKTRKKRGGVTTIVDKHNLIPGRIYFYKRPNSNWIFKGTYEETNGTNVRFNNWSGAENQGENMGRIGGDDQQYTENINRIETIWTIDTTKLPEVLSHKITSFIGGKRRKKRTRKKRGGLTEIADKNNLVPGKIYFYKKFDNTWIYKGTYVETIGTSVHFNNWSGVGPRLTTIFHGHRRDNQHVEDINQIEKIWTVDSGLPHELSSKISSFIGGKRRKKRGGDENYDGQIWKRTLPDGAIVYYKIIGEVPLALAGSHPNMLAACWKPTLEEVYENCEEKLDVNTFIAKSSLQEKNSGFEPIETEPDPSDSEDDEVVDELKGGKRRKKKTRKKRGGGRKKKGGLLGPRELEVGRQYLYTGPEPHMMPQAEWQTPVRITVTYKGRNVPGLTPNQHYFDGEREFHDIFSLDNDEIAQHIQPWVQNPRPPAAPAAPAAAASRPRRESTCENCTIMGGRRHKKKTRRRRKR